MTRSLQILQDSLFDLAFDRQTDGLELAYSLQGLSIVD